jgi:type IV pilus assembly protein PilC
MEEHEVFSPMVVQMVRVGEETGALEDMLARVTDLFDDEVNTTVESLTASLEPLLIVAMGVIVGAILLSVYLPMFRAIDLVK